MIVTPIFVSSPAGMPGYLNSANVIEMRDLGADIIAKLYGITAIHQVAHLICLPVGKLHAINGQ